MKPENFEIYRSILKDRSGIIVTTDKGYLLESRLSPIAKENDFASVEDMAPALKAPGGERLIERVIEAMTTNETSFFRDQRPFDMFKDFLLPTLQQKRDMKKKIDIWCAAASSGQEPYSLAMILKDLQASTFGGWSSDIFATDISNDILEQAKQAVYSQFEVQRGLPIQMLMSYFTQDEDKWNLKDEIKNMVRYAPFNLLDNMSALGQFDLIFCRNVLIYFDEPTKADILARMRKQLAPDGFLMLGGAETVIGITDEFVPLPNKRGVYVPKDSIYLQSTEDGQNTSQALA